MLKMNIYRILLIVFMVGSILSMDTLMYYFKGYFSILNDPTIGSIIVVNLFLNVVGLTTIFYSGFSGKNFNDC